MNCLSLLYFVIILLLSVCILMKELEESELINEMIAINSILVDKNHSKEDVLKFAILLLSFKIIHPIIPS